MAKTYRPYVPERLYLTGCELADPIEECACASYNDHRSFAHHDVRRPPSAPDGYCLRDLGQQTRALTRYAVTEPPPQ